MNTQAPTSHLKIGEPRFQIGQEVFVVAFHYEPSLAFGLNFPDFTNIDTLCKVDIVKLTVKERHQVPWNNDAEQKLAHDGYVLQDTQGNVFHNQYPMATYGQSSNHGNYFFNFFGTHDARKELQAAGKALVYFQLEEYYACLCTQRVMLKEQIRRSYNTEHVAEVFREQLKAVRDEITHELATHHGAYLDMRQVWPGVPGSEVFEVRTWSSNSVLCMKHMSHDDAAMHWDQLQRSRAEARAKREQAEDCFRQISAEVDTIKGIRDFLFPCQNLLTKHTLEPSDVEKHLLGGNEALTTTEIEGKDDGH